MTGRAVLSWSSGKDCAWALHVCRRDGLARIEALLTTVTEGLDRVAMHGTRVALLRAQAAALGLELIEVPLPFPCTNADYEARMGAACAALVARGFDTMVFGDLLLEDVRAYREAQLAGTGLAPLFPLFGADTAALAARMLEGGIEARIVTCDPTRVPQDLAGRRWDAALIADLPPGVDPCGENGEFHTCVTNAPGFDAPIAVTPGDVVVRDGFAYADMIPA
ncbi:MAG: putative ATPases of PP-loop superfamily [Rhodobacteraceae bacterium HLUCCA08]|nr:MAG: putative ATPases of PP-loop superfamily [Rhodobacteraceae bacterium HLUCCA08]